jgi:hypothetical protein
MHTINIRHNNDPGLCARKIWAYLARQINIYRWEGEDALDSFLCDMNILKNYIEYDMNGMKAISLWWHCDSETGYTDLRLYQPNDICNKRFKIKIDPPYDEIKITRIYRTE